MKTESIPIAELHQDPANVRRHGARNIAAIKASLQRFGQQKPIVVDAQNVVRAGNGTLAAAIELGWSAVDCVRSDLGGVELTAFAIADNRSAELAEWSDDLGAMLEQLVADGVQIESVGFTPEEVKTICDLRDSPDFDLPDYQVEESESKNLRTFTVFLTDEQHDRVMRKLRPIADSIPPSKENSHELGNALAHLCSS